MNNKLNTNDFFNTDHLKSNLKKRAMRGAGVAIFTSAFNFFIHFFSTIILARLLTPNDFGLVAMVTTFSLLLQNFGVNGFTEAIIQGKDINHRTISTLFWINFIISISLTILFILMAPFIAWFYNAPQVKNITIGVAFSIIAGGMYTIHMAILQRTMQFYIASWIIMIAATLSTVLTIVMAWHGCGYWALVTYFVTRPLMISIGSWFFCRWRPGRFGKIKEILPMLKFAMHTYGNFTLNYFSRNIDKLLIGWRYAAASLGYYKKAYDLFSLPASQLIVPLSNVALSALSRLINEPDKFRRYYLDSIAIIAFIGMPLSAMLTLAGEDIMLLILGPQWTKAGEIFCYFGASIGIMLIYGTQGWLHLSLGRPDRWLHWGIFECITTSLFFVIGLPFGAEGVAIAYTVSYYILAAPCLWYAGAPINLPLSSLFSATWRYFIAAMVAGILSYYALYSADAIIPIFKNLHLFFRIIVSSILCLFLYLSIIVALYRGLQPITHLISTANQMLPRKSRNIN